MKKILAVVMLFVAFAANAETTATGTATQTQSTSSQASAGTAGNGNGAYIISNSNIPTNTTEKLLNVSAGVLGAFASTVNSFNCTYTKAGGNAAGPGASLTLQFSANDTDFCVKGWTQAELVRQSTVTDDAAVKQQLQQAAINVKCTLDDDIYEAMKAAGVTCQTKPKGYEERHKEEIQTSDGKTAKVRYVAVYDKAQP